MNESLNRLIIWTFFFNNILVDYLFHEIFQQHSSTLFQGFLYEKIIDRTTNLLQQNAQQIIIFLHKIEQLCLYLHGLHDMIFNENLTIAIDDSF